MGTARSSSHATILVVDDDAQLRKSVARYLRHFHYNVLDAVSADDALIILDVQEGKIDLVFSDVHMPGSLNGPALARWIRRYKPHIKVILTSGQTFAEHCSCQRLEQDSFLSKPYEFAKLIEIIEQLLS